MYFIQYLNSEYHEIKVPNAGKAIKEFLKQINDYYGNRSWGGKLWHRPTTVYYQRNKKGKKKVIAEFNS